MRGTKTIFAVAVAAAVGVFGMPPLPAKAADSPMPYSAVVSVPGHGWGHGRGMGQWGARGLADQGKTHEQILMTYYSDSTIGSRSVSEDIRVLVETSPDVLVTSGSPFTVVMGGRTVHTSTSSQPFARGRWDGSAYVLERGGSRTGPWTRVTSSTAYPIFRPGSSMLELVFASGFVRMYRGDIHTRNSSSGVRALNVLPLQSYLYGVVPAEMPASWPAEALRAQSVAARTYAVYKKDHARANGTMFDICATTQCQVYSGYGYRSSVGGSLTVSERSTTNDAIDATAGKVVLYGGKPILAEFSSSTGGHTAPGSVPYQKAVPDPGDVVSPHHDWRASITVREIEARWPQVGRLTGVTVTDRDGFGDWGGRVRQMRLEGTEGSLTISGGAWRTAWAWPGRTNGVRGTFFTVLVYAGTLVRAPAPLVVPIGETRIAKAQIRNTGTASWPVGGTIRVGTSSPSPLANDAWITPTRAASVARNLTDPGRSSVGPGQVAEFDIPIEGTRIGTFTETLRQTADGLSTMTPSFRLQVQVLGSWVDEVPNLLSSPSFDDGLAPWRMSGTRSADGASDDGPRHGHRGLRLTKGGTKTVTQRVRFAGGRARTFTIGGFNRGVRTSTAGGPIDLRVVMRYSDRSARAFSVRFPEGPHDWVYRERTFTTDARRDLSWIDVSARSVYQYGTTYFDALRLHESALVNASFEDGSRYWTRDGFVPGDGSTGVTSRDGDRSLVLNGAPGSKSLSQRLPLRARRTERFALSFWHKAEGLAADGGEAAVTLTLATTGGPDVTKVPIPLDDHDWTYVETIVRAPHTVTSAEIAASIADQQGKVFVDAIRVTRTFTYDPSFEGGDAWRLYGDGVGDEITAVSSALEGASMAALTGAARQGVRQLVAIGGGAGSRYRLQGWSRSAGLSTSGFSGYVVAFRNIDGTQSVARVKIPSGTRPWTFREVEVRAPKRFSGADVYLQHNDRGGTSYFDAIRIERV